MIQAHDLQRILRMFGPPLDTVEVTPKSELVLTDPHKVDVRAIVNVHGLPQIMEVEDLDLRRFNDADDIAGFVGQLRTALDERAKAAA